MAKTSKKVKVQDLRALSVAELNDKVLTIRKNLLNLRLKKAEIKNPLELRWLKRDVARMLTLIKEKTSENSAQVK